MKTVAVLEGWAGGPKVSRLFRQRLDENGFEITKKIHDADFIIAHSTGCHMLPKKFKADTVMLIDPPYWPGESIARRWLNMSKAELKYLRKAQGNRKFWSDKLWEAFYIFAKPAYTCSILRNESHLHFLVDLKDKNVILVRNTDDEFCSPDIKNKLKSYKNIAYAEIEGYHGNYYLNPQPYIDLLLENI